MAAAMVARSAGAITALLTNDVKLVVKVVPSVEVAITTYLESV
jgi:hypothetical protein